MSSSNVQVTFRTVLRVTKDNIMSLNSKDVTLENLTSFVQQENYGYFNTETSFGLNVGDVCVIYRTQQRNSFLPVPIK